MRSVMDTDTVARLLSMPAMLDTKTCKCIAEDDDKYTWPCGLMVARMLNAQMPGSVLVCLQAVHEYHHAQNHKNPPVLVESVNYSADYGAVTFTCSCDCRKEERA